MCQAVREWAEEERKIGRSEGRKEGRKEGHKQGEADKAFSIIRNLLLRGTSEEEIMQITECDKEFIERVKSVI